MVLLACRGVHKTLPRTNDRILRQPRIFRQSTSSSQTSVAVMQPPLERVLHNRSPETLNSPFLYVPINLLLTATPYTSQSRSTFDVTSAFLAPVDVSCKACDRCTLPGYISPIGLVPKTIWDPKYLSPQPSKLTSEWEAEIFRQVRLVQIKKQSGCSELKVVTSICTFATLRSPHGPQIWPHCGGGALVQTCWKCIPYR